MYVSPGYKKCFSRPMINSRIKLFFFYQVSKNFDVNTPQIKLNLCQNCTFPVI